MDHPILAPTVLAPEQSQSTSTATTILTPIESLVGRITAAAACTILEATDEFGDRGLSPATKDQIKERFWTLYRVRQLLVPTWDFDQIARGQGVAALRAADVAPALAEIAVEETLRVLQLTIRDTLN